MVTDDRAGPSPTTLARAGVPRQSARRRRGGARGGAAVGRGAASQPPRHAVMLSLPLRCLVLCSQLPCPPAQRIRSFPCHPIPPPLARHHLPSCTCTLGPPLLPTCISSPHPRAARAPLTPALPAAARPALRATAASAATTLLSSAQSAATPPLQAARACAPASDVRVPPRVRVLPPPALPTRAPAVPVAPCSQASRRPASPLPSCVSLRRLVPVPSRWCAASGPCSCPCSPGPWPVFRPGGQLSGHPSAAKPLHAAQRSSDEPHGSVHLDRRAHSSCARVLASTTPCLCSSSSCPSWLPMRAPCRTSCSASATTSTPSLATAWRRRHRACPTLSMPQRACHQCRWRRASASCRPCPSCRATAPSGRAPASCGAGRAPAAARRGAPARAWLSRPARRSQTPSCRLSRHRRRRRSGGSADRRASRAWRASAPGMVRVRLRRCGCRTERVASMCAR